MKRLTLLLQRLLVFLLGVLTVWLIAFVFFDFADRWLPWVIALAVTYGLAAYVILPRAIRLGLMIQQRGRVPSYTTTADGLPGDPVNLALIGTMPELRRAFETIGWSAADPLGLTSSWRMVGAFVLNRPYPRAPFSTLYLFGRGQDVGFQQPIGDSPRRRNTSASGDCRWSVPNRPSTPHCFGSMRFDRPTMNGQYGWGLGRKTLDFHSPGLASKSPMRRTLTRTKSVTSSSSSFSIGASSPTSGRIFQASASPSGT